MELGACGPRSASAGAMRARAASTGRDQGTWNGRPARRVVLPVAGEVPERAGVGTPSAGPLSGSSGRARQRAWKRVRGRRVSVGVGGRRWAGTSSAPVGRASVNPCLPRVARRASGHARRATRGYGPSPRGGEEVRQPSLFVPALCSAGGTDVPPTSQGRSRWHGEGLLPLRCNSSVPERAAALSGISGANVRCTRRCVRDWWVSVGVNFVRPGGAGCRVSCLLRVAGRASERVRRFTRGYGPSPRWGEEVRRPSLCLCGLCVRRVAWGGARRGGACWRSAAGSCVG